MKKIVIITGLTASGKSGLANEIAKNFNGEIISADSVQVYRDLNIGSAKESEQIMKKIQHHLINIKDFKQSYNVGDFVFDCSNAIEDILSRHKLPIIVGGTSMYIKALLEGYNLGGVKANEELRKKYNDLASTYGNEFVWNKLNEINPSLAKNVHPNNLKRVIRYIEISLSNDDLTKQESILKNYDVLTIGIVADRQAIYDKINKRVDIMLSYGLEGEVRGLVKKGATRECQSMNSIGYKEWFDYFDGTKTYDETIDLIKQHTRNYCKRQLTFLKTMPQVQLLDLENAKIKIQEFLSD